jgi:hypothetical protein
MAIFEIWADEAWTHGGGEPNRYWCFFGGVMGPQAAIDRLDSELSKIKRAHNLAGEVAWANVRAKNLPPYRAMVDCLVDLLQRTDLHFRQVFLDRSLIRVDQNGAANPVADLDVQYLIYYQFLKHAFGIRYLPVAPPGQTHRILIRLDDHSSQRHKSDLQSFVENLKSTLHRPDLSIEVTFHDSKKSVRLQICDLLIGAAGRAGQPQRGRRRRERGRGGEGGAT